MWARTAATVASIVSSALAVSRSLNNLCWVESLAEGLLVYVFGFVLQCTQSSMGGYGP